MVKNVLKIPTYLPPEDNIPCQNHSIELTPCLNSWAQEFSGNNSQVLGYCSVSL